ncbi:MAG: aspartyl/asparaginyl beta-hydroxylase domain-containing protein [Sphingomicrobium sp.]
MSTIAGVADLGDLLDRGEAFARDGDDRAAMAFYQAALQTAQTNPIADPRMVERLRTAQAFIEQRVAHFQQSLDASLDNLEGADPVARLRMTHALEMLRGTREIFPQEPSVLYYPYLAQRQFFERDEFDWVSEIEAATPAIREELLALIAEGGEFRPYVEDEPNRPRRQFAHLNNDPSWSAFYLWQDSERVDANAERCPRTMQALAKVPLSTIGRRTPVALFSRLEPGAHIPAHHGMLNCRLICHLPIVVPPGCWLRVGNETREWEEGKLLIFDDSIAHEARNPSGELRVVLLFDVWRPEISLAERAGISAIFEAIDDFRTLPDA